MPFYLGNSDGYRYMMDAHAWGFPFFIIPLVVWSAFWTGLALWHAAKRDEKGWFIAFLFIHTAGILEIIYLLFVAKIFATKASSSKKRKRS